jgi:hypothetical protein
MAESLFRYRAECGECRRKERLRNVAAEDTAPEIGLSQVRQCAAMSLIYGQTGSICLELAKVDVQVVER